LSSKSVPATQSSVSGAEPLAPPLTVAQRPLAVLYLPPLIEEPPPLAVLPDPPLREELVPLAMLPLPPLIEELEPVAMLLSPPLTEELHPLAVPLAPPLTERHPDSGGKYQIYEGGTRVPFILRWPGKIEPGVSKALVNQIDFLASFAALLGIALKETQGIDSRNSLAALIGDDDEGMPYMIEEHAEKAAEMRVLLRELAADDRGLRARR